MPVSQPTTTLACGACACTADDAERGWRGYHDVDIEGNDVVFILCPSCSERLYGEDEPDAA
jgi:hypothetical protein